MTSYKLKQIGLSLCLMASLLFGSASACTCSHHEETKKTDTDTDCHSHHESTENVEMADTGIAVEDDCICAVQQRSPFVASKSANKEFSSNDTAAYSQQAVSDLEFTAIVKFNESTPDFTNDLSYSNTLKSLLPSRAPPRL